MTNINKIFLKFLFFSILISCESDAQEHSFIPKNGFVPDKETASLIAEVILKPIYGENNIERQKPFKIFLENDVWKVMGTLTKIGDKEEVLGGVFIIKISKKDAKIIRVTHSR